MIFVTLFAEGAIPFGILLASSIVQDGHGMLPLLAESKKGFVSVKIINLSIGLFVGLAWYVADIYFKRKIKQLLSYYTATKTLRL